MGMSEEVAGKGDSNVESCNTCRVCMAATVGVPSSVSRPNVTSAAAVNSEHQPFDARFYGNNVQDILLAWASIDQATGHFLALVRLICLFPVM